MFMYNLKDALCYTQHGALYPEGKGDLTPADFDKFYIHVFEDYWVKIENGKEPKFTYKKNIEIKKDTFFKFVKCLSGKTFKELQICDYRFSNKPEEKEFYKIYGDGPVPHKSLINVLKELNITERYYNRLHRPSFKEVAAFDQASEQAKLFPLINVTEIINSVPKEKLDVSGRQVTRYAVEDDKEVKKNYDVIFELYNVKVSELLDESRQESYAKAVKVWCTSTNKEAWLWVPDNINTGFEAVAFTSVLEENIIDKLQHTIRQGDLFGGVFREGITFEEAVAMKKEEQDKRHFTADEYFNLLRAES